MSVTSASEPPICAENIDEVQDVLDSLTTEAETTRSDDDGEILGTGSLANALRSYLKSLDSNTSKSGCVLRSHDIHNGRLKVRAARELFGQQPAKGKAAAQQCGTDVFLGDKLPDSEARSPKGVADDEIRQWVWILSAETADIGIKRFVSDTGRKPLFLLNMLLRKDQVIREAENFISLLHYINEHYIGNSPPARFQSSFHLTRRHFFILLDRLTSKCLAAWPGLLPSVSRLVVAFIEHMPEEIRGSRTRAHAARCVVFNQALHQFTKRPAMNPMDDMMFNWEAQKILLRLSSSIRPALHISKNGYRDIRRVMAALPKTSPEREVALRAAKTWPPYRQDWDGRDEERQPEDDLTRLARAGILQREAGYAEEAFDRALNALAGSVIGRRPTTQTRGKLPCIWSGHDASLNIYSEWAANIITTRDVREAWRAFNTPPQPNLQPNAMVYAEIFKKLFARPAQESSRALPGDVKEVFPVHDGNLSTFEVARLSPPTPEKLYNIMLSSGVRPVGECLNVLVREADSKDTALQYLENSPYRGVAPVLRESEFGGLGNADRRALLRQLPASTLSAWIRMLCRTHKAHMTQIEEAVKLANAYHKHSPLATHTDTSCYYTIIEALAMGRVIYGRRAAANNVLTLKLFMTVWDLVVDWKGIDDNLFELLCLMAWRSLRLRTFKDVESGRLHSWAHNGRPAERSVMQFVRVYAAMGEAFKKLTKPVQGFGGSAEERQCSLTHLVTGQQIYRYMRALGAIGDGAGMVELMRWVMKAWDQDHLLPTSRERQGTGYHYLTLAMSYFSTVARQTIDVKTVKALKQDLEKLRLTRGCTWVWPGPIPDRAITFEADMVVAGLWSRVKQLLHSNADEKPHIDGIKERARQLLHGTDKQKPTTSAPDL